MGKHDENGRKKKLDEQVGCFHSVDSGCGFGTGAANGYVPYEFGI